MTAWTKAAIYVNAAAFRTFRTPRSSCGSVIKPESVNIFLALAEASNSTGSVASAKSAPPEKKATPSHARSS